MHTYEVCPRKDHRGVEFSDMSASTLSASTRNQSRRLKSQLKKNNRVAHIYEVRPRKDHRRVDLISDALPFGQSP